MKNLGGPRRTPVHVPDRQLVVRRARRPRKGVRRAEMWAPTVADDGDDATGGTPAATDLFAFGGETSSGLRTETQGYDPVTNTWSAFAPLPAGRSYAGGGAVDNKAYVLGGWDGTVGHDQVYEYDPTTDTWDTSRAPCPTTFSHVSTCVLDGKIYVAGGGLHAGFGFYRYTPATNIWERLTDLPVARWFPTLLGVGGFVYVFGGDVDSTIDNGTDNHYAYEVATNGFTQLADMSTVNGYLHAAAAAAAYDGFGYVMGGINLSSSRTNKHLSYDPATNEFGATPLAALPVSVYHHKVAVVGTRIHMTGGRSGVANEDHYAYTPANDTWTITGASGATDGSTAVMPVATYGHVFAGLAP